MLVVVMKNTVVVLLFIFMCQASNLESTISYSSHHSCFPSLKYYVRLILIYSLVFLLVFSSLVLFIFERVGVHVDDECNGNSIDSVPLQFRDRDE